MEPDPDAKADPKWHIFIDQELIQKIIPDYYPAVTHLTSCFGIEQMDFKEAPMYVPSRKLPPLFPDTGMDLEIDH